VTPGAQQVYAGLYDKGQVTNLGAFLPSSVNNLGQIAGEFYNNDGFSHACVYKPGPTY
jgi:hypothetical protein